MWKAIFIESCLLSALIFGGFYIHSKIIEEEIVVSEGLIKELSLRQRLAHISGNSILESKPTKNHLSGNSSKIHSGHISGIVQEDQTTKLESPE